MIRPDLTKEQVIDAIRKSRSKLLYLGVRSLGLFGSFARGDAQAQSDIDLLVEFEEDKKNFYYFIDTFFLLEDVLGRRVELVTKGSLSPYIEPHVLREVEYVSLTN
jgi:predicted nucleotidyltransferase